MSDSSSNVHPNASLAAQPGLAPRAQATNQELALMADRITDAVLVCDAQRCIRWANPAFTRLTGYTLEDAYGRQVEELLSGPQTDAEAVRRINQWISQGEGVERVAMCQHHKDGEAFWVERTVQPLPGPDGVVDRYIEILTDLRAQRWAQTEHHSRLEAEVALARRTTFLGQLSLGMRGPLNTIVGFSQLLDMDIQASPDARRQVGNIQQAAQQLIQLLDKAVKLANAEDRSLPVHAQRVNLLAVSKEASHALEAAARDRRITLVIEGDSPTGWADPVHVRDVLTQLLRFAISHCPPDNTIWVACRHSPDHGRALIEVNHQGGDGLLPADCGQKKAAAAVGCRLRGGLLYQSSGGKFARCRVGFCAAGAGHLQICRSGSGQIGQGAAGPCAVWGGQRVRAAGQGPLLPGGDQSVRTSLHPGVSPGAQKGRRVGVCGDLHQASVGAEVRHLRRTL